MNNIEGILKEEIITFREKEYFRAVSKLMNFRELVNNIYIVEHIITPSKIIYDIHFDELSLIVMYYPMVEDIVLISNTDDKLDQEMNYNINNREKIIFDNEIVNIVNLIMSLFKMYKDDGMPLDEHSNMYTIKL